MRLTSQILFAGALLLAACNNNKPNSLTIKSKDGKESVSIDVNSANTASSDMEKKMEELKKLTPLSTDQLKAMLPEQIMGLKRTSFNATSMMGYSVGDATYRDSASDKQIHLSIIDCAGEAGAGIFSVNYWTRMNVQSETDNGYTKTVDFNGGRAVETYDKSADRYELTFVGSDRLLVTVQGEKIGLDAVKDLAKNLNLKAG